jgi:hypothetical protein
MLKGKEWLLHKKWYAWVEEHVSPKDQLKLVKKRPE